MKILLFSAAFISVIGFSYCAEGQTTGQHRAWLEDSYRFGKDGNNCNDIYYDYGTGKQTFVLDNLLQLKNYYNACKEGEKDRLTGQNNLQKVLNPANEHPGSD